jgi:hypothetical protein
MLYNCTISRSVSIANFNKAVCIRFIKYKSVRSVTIKCQTYAGSTLVVIQHIPENDPCNRNTGANVNERDKQKLYLPRRILNGMKMRYINIFSFFTIHLT